MQLGRRRLRTIKNIITQNISRLWGVGQHLGTESCLASSNRAFPGPRPQNCLSGVSGPAWLVARPRAPWAPRPSSSPFSCLLRALPLVWLSSSLCPGGVRATRLCPEDLSMPCPAFLPMLIACELIWFPETRASGFPGSPLPLLLRARTLSFSGRLAIIPLLGKGLGVVPAG